MNRVFNLTEMVHMMNVAKDEGNSFVIRVMTPELEAPEIIFNVAENLKAKIDYYSQAYTEELTLKNNAKVFIVDYGIVTIDHSNDLVTIIKASI